MNNLVKLLIEDLLNSDSRIVAIFGGGFKPPTAGHFEVVKKALTQFPEINDFIVYVGSGVRDGITQAESLDIWNLYRKHFPSNVKIETSSAPVKAVLDYAKNNPNDTIYWILGSREGNEGDIKDLIDRTKSIGKYPNIEVKNIITNDSISGTKARQALKANNKEEFLKYIPNIPEQEQIWNIVSPVIKEIVTDTEVICDNCGWHWKIADGGDDLYICHNILPSGDMCGHDNNPDLKEGTCGYDTDVKTGKKLDTPGGLEEGRPKKKDPKVGTGKKPEGSGRRLYTDENPKDTVHVKFKTKEDIVDTLNKESFKAKSHARQSQIINLIHQRVRAAYGKAKDPEVKSRLKRALDYIESRKEASKEKTERLRKMKEASDPQAGTALPYGSGFAPIKENNEKTWDLKEGIVSLTKYMVDNGLNIKPLPKVKFISNDKENASNLLGRTAYYNPADKSITLYTMDRHPKDVLRSFSHEMIHHMQNLEGKLDNINTTNTNEGGDLPEMEREAYEKGNMMLRNWEDSIKSEKYLKEYKQYVLTELFEKDLSNIEKISPLEYIVGDGKDIEAKYYFRLDEPDSNKWSIHWNFTNNNKNTSPEAWKKITTTSFKVLKDFINTKNPTYISISGNENKSGKNAKLNIYKSKSFLEKLENIFNNQYLIKNDNEDFILMKSIEEAYKHSINESVRHGKEKYEDALYYWQNLDINSKSKIERWSAIKRKVKREVLQEVYNIKNV
jgi:hypothetical protein